jgi:UDP-N-acetylglucosamine 1-carboxyvinyltransferase
MTRIRIKGGRPLAGEIRIGGAKNAALPLMCASLLTDAPMRYSNVPDLADVRTLAALLSHHGADVSRDPSDGAVVISAPRIVSVETPYEIVRSMRASVLVLGPLLARAGRARVALPGGCAIGSRPVDIHVEGLRTLGAEVEIRDGFIEASSPGRLQAATVALPFPSVGATENVMMAAALARGTTVISNAAREPEIVDLAVCLNKMGASVTGAGTGEIIVQGRDSLSGCLHDVVPDRIEAGTYMMAAVATRGEVELVGARMADLASAIGIMREAGVAISETARGIRVHRSNEPLRGVMVSTEPHPGFPTDLQAQVMALLSVAEGESIIRENIFENRFMHVPELARLGADIEIRGREARVVGVGALSGAPVEASDLRASSCLVIAGLAASGETTVSGLRHLDRGYERLEEKLVACGAEVERLPV